MPTLRWKLATLVLTVSTVLLAVTRPPEQVSARSTASPAVKRAADLALRTPRPAGPARPVALDESELVEQLRAERDPRRLVWLSRRLAVIGGDVAVEGLAELVGHPDRQVSNVALTAIGEIGSEAATAFLLELEPDSPPRMRSHVIEALALTRRPEARTRLMMIAQTPADPARSDAIAHLSAFADSEVITLLATLVRTTDHSTARRAIWTLGAIPDDQARGVLLGLLAGPDSRLAAIAIGELPAEAFDHDMRDAMTGALVTGSASVATAAAEWLGRTGDPTLLPHLEEVAVRGAEPVRRAAVEAIAEIGGPAASERLHSLLVKGDTMVASEAADALIATGEPEDRARVIAVARARGPNRSSALTALRGERGLEVESIMIELARTGTAQERRVALENLAESGSDRAFEAVVAAARDGGGDIYAVQLLASGPVVRARAALSDLARTGEGEVKLAALEALSEMGLDATARDALVTTLTDGDASAKRTAATALVRAGTPEARRALLDAVSTGDHATSEAAIRVLLEIDGSPAARDALISVAHRGKLRTHVLDALLERGAPEAIGLARQALGSADDREAESTASALARSVDPSAGDLLREAAASSSPRARRVAAEALAERGDPASRASLDGLTRDGDPEVRHAAYAGLAEVGTREAIDHLTTVAARGTTVADKVAAISALGDLSGGRGHAPLADVLARERDPEVVMAAIREARTGGAVLDDALLGVAANPELSREVRVAAAERLDEQGSLDEGLRDLLAPEPAAADE